jgi:S1-C subfamily serine protease
MAISTHPSGTRLLLWAVVLLALTSGGCISVWQEEEGIPLDAPVALHPPARALRGASLDSILVETKDTVAQEPLDTRLIRRLALKAKPGVVSIYTQTQTPIRVRLFPLTPSFRVRIRGLALGSGFFIHPSGYVLTNNHVVRGSESVRVLLSDGKDFGATIIARDPVYDLALLKVKGPSEGFPVLPRGDSDDVGVGDMVIAIGNPLGLGHTVTAGIISQTGRNLSGVSKEEAKAVDFIQTDTAINPGSSGGPLITLRGAWVGVNTAGIVQAQNIGFAVPSDHAVEFLEEVLAGKGVPTVTTD